MNRTKQHRSIEETIMTKIKPIIRHSILNEQLRGMEPMDYVKDWYISAYPTDTLGKTINPELSFSHLWKYMQMGVDAYILIAVADSIVRERIFGELAERLGTKYDDVYNTWLYKQIELTDADYIR